MVSVAWDFDLMEWYSRGLKPQQWLCATAGSPCQVSPVARRAPRRAAGCPPALRRNVRVPTGWSPLLPSSPLWWFDFALGWAAARLPALVWVVRKAGHAAGCSNKARFPVDLLDGYGLCRKLADWVWMLFVLCTCWWVLGSREVRDRAVWAGAAFLWFLFSREFLLFF